MISKYMNTAILFALGLFTVTSDALADQVSGRCPFSCQTEDIPREYCKDWRQGSTCIIEIRGSIVKRECPFTCRTEGINKQFCRDWRRGNICYVHDLRHNTPYRSNIGMGAGEHYNHDFRRPEPPRDFRHPQPPRDFKRPEPPRVDYKRPEPPRFAPQRPAPKTTGKVSKRPCPYSCRTEGIPKNKCKDWKENGLCVIERL